MWYFGNNFIRQTKGQKPLTKTCLQPKIEHSQHSTFNIDIPNGQYVSKWTFFDPHKKWKRRQNEPFCRTKLSTKVFKLWTSVMVWCDKWNGSFIDLAWWPNHMCCVVGCWTLNVFKRNLKRVFDIFKWPNESWCFNYFEYFWMDSHSFASNNETASHKSQSKQFSSFNNFRYSIEIRSM